MLSVRPLTGSPITTEQEMSKKLQDAKKETVITLRRLMQNVTSS